jgi:hypothetical protein
MIAALGQSVTRMLDSISLDEGSAHRRSIYLEKTRLTQVTILKFAYTKVNKPMAHAPKMITETNYLSRKVRRSARTFYTKTKNITC